MAVDATTARGLADARARKGHKSRKGFVTRTTPSRGGFVTVSAARGGYRRRQGGHGLGDGAHAALDGLAATVARVKAEPEWGPTPTERESLAATADTLTWHAQLQFERWCRANDIPTLSDPDLTADQARLCAAYLANRAHPNTAA